jgi:hypothetical protein
VRHSALIPNTENIMVIHQDHLKSIAKLKVWAINSFVAKVVPSSRFLCLLLYLVTSKCTWLTAASQKKMNMNELLMSLLEAFWRLAYQYQLKKRFRLKIKTSEAVVSIAEIMLLGQINSSSAP